MKKSLLDSYEAELLKVLPDRVIPRRYSPEIRELLSKIERIASNHYMDLKTYLQIIGFRYERAMHTHADVAPFHKELLETYPHKQVYALSKKYPVLCHRIAYHASKSVPKQTVSQYVESIGFKVIQSRKLAKTLLTLDKYAVHRVLIRLQLTQEMIDTLDAYFNKVKPENRDVVVEEFFKTYHYVRYEKLRLRDLAKFDADMLVELLYAVYPQGSIENIKHVHPAIKARVAALTEDSPLTFTEWLNLNGFRV